MKSILLTFDLEEFDLPREQNAHIDEQEMYTTSMKGLTNLLNILNKHNIQATFFTTANFAKKYPKTLKNLAKDHEIASHGFSHSEPVTLENMKAAKDLKEEIIGKPVRGFRAPRFQIEHNEIPLLDEIGFEYDSSTHPTIAPGKYVKINQPRYPHMLKNMIELPVTTLPLFPFLRAPNNWFMFRNIPKPYHRIYPKLNFLSSDYTMALFHPWEFTDISKFNIPKHFTNKTGKPLVRILDSYIKLCKNNNFKFQTCEQFLKKHLVAQYLKPQTI